MSAGMPAELWLNQFGLLLQDAYGHKAYQVGSSVHSKEWRDVDVRLMLPDDEYDAMFGDVAGRMNPKFAALTLAWSALGKQMTGLPIDFQFQRLSEANEKYPVNRIPLMEVRR